MMRNLFITVWFHVFMPVLNLFLDIEQIIFLNLPKTYVVGTKKYSLNEMVPLNTEYICLKLWVKKY